MVGLITDCWLFTYNTPATDVRAFLPASLSPVTYEGCAFYNVVVSRIKKMRPAGVPAWLGFTYWHVAYRLHVRLPRGNAEPIEGLYFLRSDCSSRVLSIAGRWLTDFNFHSAAIQVARDEAGVDIHVLSAEAPARARVSSELLAALPSTSVFSSVSEAADFLKYRPFGISVDSSGIANVVRISRREEDWQARIVRVDTAEWAYLAGRSVSPEVCYQLAPIEYRWNRGITVPHSSR